MEERDKVFSSSILRKQIELKNNLYELINIKPAVPAKVDYVAQDEKIDFQPKINKHYIPKKISKLKVKTVRDVRCLLEKDVYTDLHKDLEKQQNLLLRKIRTGALQDEDTKTLALNMLNDDKPISRSAWQIIMNINPETQKACVQFVHWKGKRIRIIGSKGGRNHFVCRHDLSLNLRPQLCKQTTTKNCANVSRRLLRDSLAVKFKPGPLCKKKYLDISYQKYSVGNIDLAHLPKIGLEIQPTYDGPLDPLISNVLNCMHNEDGLISHKWAEFSVSVFGRLNNKDVQPESDTPITFDLNYNYKQKRILMRRDSIGIDNDIMISEKNDFSESCDSANEVKLVLNDLIDSVDISLNQDLLCIEDDPRESFDNSTIMNNSLMKTKNKFVKLKRLGVDLIKTESFVQQEKCHQLHCVLGCVCSSINHGNHIKLHCGLVECMFECRCGTENSESQHDILLPVTAKLDKGVQNFGTDLFTGEKNNNFQSNLSSTDKTTKPILLILVSKLKCENVEPWCLVHNLYKCFCKGKFTERAVQNIPEGLEEQKSKVGVTCEVSNLEKNEKGSKTNMKNKESIIHDSLSHSGKKIDGENFIVAHRSRHQAPRVSCQDLEDSADHSSQESFHKEINNHNENLLVARKTRYSSEPLEYSQCDVNLTCARVRSYKQKLSKRRYYSLHQRIVQLEKNDNNLQIRLLDLVNKSITEDVSQDKTRVIISNPTKSSSPLPNMPLSNSLPLNRPPSFLLNTQDENKDSRIMINKMRLVKWLEYSYKQYKQKTDLGCFRYILEPPKLGKLAWYPWDFILGRYKQRTNLFLTTKQEPYRIFMAINTEHKFFENTINIDDIRFTDIHKYPATVKNLLTNATGFKQNLCILRGLNICWELVGLATKVNRAQSDNEENIADSENSPSVQLIENVLHSETLFNGFSRKNPLKPYDMAKEHVIDSVKNDNFQDCTNIATDVNTFKWFVTMIEEDFIEIQFYNKGFFVKYESIRKALSVARISSKTVRLSPQSCSSSNTPFGIYAIPSLKDDCVFIGPYEEHEVLGIEIVKSIPNVTLKKTRGTWITTSDNAKVIEDPISFMPSIDDTEFDEIKNTGLDCDNSSAYSETNQFQNQTENKTTKETKGPEIISDEPSSIETKRKAIDKLLLNPIKIKKTNGFYHIAPKGYLDKVPISSNSLNILNQSLIQVGKSTQEYKTEIFSTRSSLKLTDSQKIQKPVAEIAPLPKLVTKTTPTEAVGKFGTMQVLKPEEINKKICAEIAGNEGNSIGLFQDSDTMSCTEYEMSSDIEKFLSTAQVCHDPTAEIYEISDEECSSESDSDMEQVYIRCCNVNNLGWLRGRVKCNKKDNCKKISFQFPGFKYSDYYDSKTAFSKINQVLSRKVFVPLSLTLKWDVVNTTEILPSKLLNLKELNKYKMLTNDGLIDIEDRNVTGDSSKPKNISENDNVVGVDSISNVDTFIIENESCAMMNETMTMSDDIKNSIQNASNDVRQDMVEHL